jgi:hypothetical protein
MRSNLVEGSSADGLVVVPGSLVLENTATGNGMAGITAISTSSIQRNVS